MIKKLSDFSPLRLDQDRMLSAFILDGVKHGVLVAHRRYGKDYSCWALIWNAALLKPGLYLYLLPTIDQSTKVIWETRGEDGLTLIDRIPKELQRRKPHNIKQQIYMKNGSIIKVAGADNYKRLLGTSAMGVVFSETQDLKTMESYNYLRPALTRNKGWVCFNGTPRAYNHLKDLYDQAAENPDEWWSANLTIHDTVDLEGLPIITDKDIEAERRNGMPEELIQQEYFGDWTAALSGAYYSEQLQEARKTNRIGVFKSVPGVPVHTGWDIGFNDYTSVWALQVYGDVVYVVDYYENRGKQPEHYAKYIKETWARNKWREGFHFMPHDAAHDRLGMDKNILAQMETLKIFPMLVSRVKYQINNIVATRHMFPKFHFNEDTTKLGLKRLSEYHAAYNDKLGINADRPVHNSASHGADAMATFVRGWMKQYESTVLSKVDEWASFYGR
jgi:phage terminase large subunit